jgi:hypothetical protein
MKVIRHTRNGKHVADIPFPINHEFHANDAQTFIIHPCVIGKLGGTYDTKRDTFDLYEVVEVDGGE